MRPLRTRSTHAQPRCPAVRPPPPRCGEHAEKLGFWHQLNRRHIKPLNNTEAPSARHDEASATSWLAERWTEPKERPPLVPGVGTQQGTQQGMQFTQASQQQLSQLF